MNVVSRLTKWLFKSSERRRSPRYPEPGLVAYGGLLPLRREIGDLSSTGMFLRTHEKWYQGTRLQLTLNHRQADPDRNPEDDFIVVNCEVIWSDGEGVGLRFISSDDQERQALMRFIADVIAGVTRKNAAWKELDENVRAIIHGPSTVRDAPENGQPQFV